jgi:transcriptional regulator with XRE-family HTH domain
MIDPRAEYLINELTNLRKEAGLSQNELAERIGTQPNALRNWEQKITIPRTDSLVLWAAALGYEFDLHPIERKQRKIL